MTAADFPAYLDVDDKPVYHAASCPVPDAGFARAARIASVTAMVLGAVVLLGWGLDIAILKSVTPGLPTMKANTAVSFTLAGVSLWLQIEPSSAPQRTWIPRAYALIIVAVGVLTLGEYLFGVSFGIDELLIHAPAGDGSTVSPGRMAPNTALCAVFAGTALILLDVPSRVVRWLIQGLTIVVLAGAFVAICGYAFSVTALYGVSGYSSMAVHSAVGFAVLASGILLSRPRRGIIAILAQDNLAGSTIRRLLPLILITPLVVGWVRLQGQRAGYYGLEFGLALMVTACTGILASLALWNAHVQGASDGGRQQALRDQSFLFELGEHLRTSSASSEVLFEVSKSLGEYLQVSRCLFIEIDTVNDRATVQRDYCDGFPSLTGTRPLSSYSPESREDSNAGRTVVTRDARTDERTAPRYESGYRPANIRAHVAVPLLRHGRWVATLLASTHEPRAWEAREVALVQSVAERTWLWFEHLLASESLRQSQRDLAALNSELELRVHSRTAALRGALDEREVLLQEVHHRVKNNLQVISSLIGLQMRHVSDASARNSLDECKARVEAIALIHEKLYQAKDYTNVAFSDYARGLAANIFHATGVSRSHVALQVEIATVSLAVDRAIPCGLILNELITNALKHAFPDERSGTVRVELRRQDERMLLAVTDNGVGIPAGFDAATSTSLGMQLVIALVAQIDGQLEIVRSGGTTVRITFPIEVDE